MKLAPKRIGAYRVGPALQTYSDWFRNNIPTGRIVRLVTSEPTVSAVSIPGIPEKGPELFEELPKKRDLRKHFPDIPSPENLNQRHGNVRELIARWRKMLDIPMIYAGEETRNLMYTLDPGGVLELKRCSKSEYHEIEDRHLERVKKIVNGLESSYG